MIRKGKPVNDRNRPIAAARQALGFAPLLLLSVLLACCPVPTGASVETAFAGRIATVSAPFAIAVLDSGREVRLSLPEDAPERLTPGVRVYVEGTFEGPLVIVRRLAVLTRAGV